MEGVASQAVVGATELRGMRALENVQACIEVCDSRCESVCAARGKGAMCTAKRRA